VLAACGFQPGSLAFDARVIGDGSSGVATFRRGQNGYTGAADTSLLIEQPTTARGALTTISWELQTSQDKFGLLRFDEIFGTGPGQIPSGHTIVEAELTYVVMDTGDPAEIHDMVIGWNEATVTYNSSGVAAGAQPIVDYDVGVVAAAPASSGTQRVKVTTSLMRWSLSPSSNHGWIFVPTADGGVQLASSEAALGDRPLLTVTYGP
jgi:hypothetical protein